MINPPVHCFVCGRFINTDSQIYYVYLGRLENVVFCVDCYDKDIRDKRKSYPFPIDYYKKNFIIMNK